MKQLFLTLAFGLSFTLFDLNLTRRRLKISSPSTPYELDLLRSQKKTRRKRKKYKNTKFRKRRTYKEKNYKFKDSRPKDVRHFNQRMIRRMHTNC